MNLERIFTAVLDDDHPQSAAMRAARDAGRALRDIAWRCGVEPDDSAAAHPGIRDAADRLAGIFNERAFALSAAYADWQDDRRERLVAALAADPAFHADTRRWGARPSEHLLAVAAGISARHHDAYRVRGEAGPRLSVSWLPAGSRKLGQHIAPAAPDGPHRLLFNVGMQSDFRVLETGLEVTGHENTHADQARLGFAFAAGLLPPGHRLRDDGRLFFMMQQDRIAYFDGTAAYDAHPAERDAFRQGRLFSRDMMFARERAMAA